MKRDASKQIQERKLYWGLTHHRLIAIIIALLLVLFIAAWYALYQYNSRRHDSVSLGVSFSVKQAEELGLDWRNTYLALLNDLDINKLRLMSYWDRHEPEKDSYDFSELDWQFEQAALAGAKLHLSLGLRQPRWPECHQPMWAEKLTKTEKEAELIEYLEAVVKRYRHHPALETWQLENEFSNRNFGHCTDFSRLRLKKEYQAIKNLDPEHPVLITASDQFGLPLFGQAGDETGFAVYRRTYLEAINGYFTYPLPATWHKLRASLIQTYLIPKVIITELQAEPWGPRHITELSQDELAKSMNPEQLKDNLNYAVATGVPEIHLWGGEWWYWQKTAQGNDRMWETARKTFEKN